jgi:hypothetical protein
MIDFSKLALIGPQIVGPAAMAVINAVQHKPKHVQVAAISLAFLIICKRWRVHPGDVLQHAQNILNAVKENNPEVRAAMLYVEHHLAKEDR